MRFDFHVFAPQKEDKSISARRIFFVISVMSVFFLALWVRLLWLGQETLPTHVRPAEPMSRATILDRNGQSIASTIATFSVYAHPGKITNPQETARALSILFPDLSFSETLKNLKSPRPFTWIVRHIDPEKYMALQSLGLKGIEVQGDYRRIHLHGPLFSHVVGLTDIDQRGMSGMEVFFDRHLSGSHTHIYTSLDIRIQHIVRDALLAQIEKFHAIGGNALVVNIQTGEILAMVSLPDFYPAAPKDTTKYGGASPLFNRNVTGVYEFGSIMKILNTALFLEATKKPLSTIFNGKGPLRIGRFRVTDFQGKNAPMTVEDGFLLSSNIVNAQMAWEAGGEKQKKFFQKLGFYRPIALEMGERARTLMPKTFASKATCATVSYGYGLAISPLHMVSALSSVVSGYYTPLTLIANKGSQTPFQNPGLLWEKGREKHTPKGKRIISPEVSCAIVNLMRQAVVRGKVTKAAAKNCPVGAKTGTANRQEGGRYIKGENLTSCIAIFPTPKAQYVLLVTLDRPKSCAETQGYATAGWFAAPLAGQIIEKIAPLLNLLQPAEEAAHSGT